MLIEILKTLVLGVLVFGATLYFLQAWMIYHPRPYPDQLLKAVEPKLRRIEYSTSSGRQTAFYMRADTALSLDPPSTLWVVFSGNASLALGWFNLFAKFPDRNAGFLLIDYPGYGVCDGRPSPASIAESAESAFSLLKSSLGPGSYEVRVLGQSLGTGPALQFAAQHGVGCGVLISPFTTLLDLAKRSVGVPFAFLLRHRFDNESNLKHIDEHTAGAVFTVLHGDRDEVIPVGMGRNLARAFPRVIEYKEFHGVGHNDILDAAAVELFEAMLASKDAKS